MKTNLLNVLKIAVVAVGSILPGIAQILPSTAIPSDQLGALADKRCHGDGLSLSATPDGARLRCAFQRLEGDVTHEGLWLTSTTDIACGERFHVTAVDVGRVPPNAPAADRPKPAKVFAQLASVGVVKVTNNVARFVRDGLTEEYSVSVDGVGQDFIIDQRPDGEGELCLELEVTGATLSLFHDGAQLKLNSSNRKLAYNNLRVIDARGQKLDAQIEMAGANRLAVLIDDAEAAYPVRIDPTFSDANWFSMGGLPGANARIRAAVLDGAGNIYVGGGFTIIGDVLANNVAKWNGTSWSALGSGVNAEVLALAVSGNDLFVGGSFTSAGGTNVNRVAKWDGSAWLPVGFGVNSPVTALLATGGQVYVGGGFTWATNSGGVSVLVNGITRWDGSNWVVLNGGLGRLLGENPFVEALTVSGSDLYVGGVFNWATNTGGAIVTADGIAKWDGINWSSVGTATNGTYSPVYAVAVYGSDVYAAGAFSAMGGVSANRIAKWDGITWSGLGAGLNGDVYSLAMSGNNLCAGGYFVITTTGGSNLAKRIAKWDGSSWSAFGSGIGDSSPAPVFALVISGSDIYAGGDFLSAGGSVANYIARWNGTSWSPLTSGVGGGLSPHVNTVVVSGNDIYVGGLFTTPAPAAATNIAKWDGNKWVALGAGADNEVFALAISGTDVYAGGGFTKAGGSAANQIAKWNGNTWTTLGSGMNSAVYALAVSSNNVYAAGSFTTAGGTTANRIAKWDGSGWLALGSGMNSTVYALAVSGSNLYAGGSFTTAGGTNSSRIAKWDGSNWSALGAGMNGIVDALVVTGSEVYGGGYFTTAGGKAVNRIAKWDGIGWSALGSGLNDAVGSLTLSGSDVYAAGAFTNAGGVSASYIAKWDGSAWSTLGSGVGGLVNSLILSGTNLFVGGSFTKAGDKVSAFVAKANIDAARGKFINTSHSPINRFSCIFVDASVGLPYRIQTTHSLDTASWTDYTNFTYTEPLVVTDDSTYSATNKFFRAVSP